MDITIAAEAANHANDLVVTLFAVGMPALMTGVTAFAAWMSGRGHHDQPK
jgi:hypothetical protein